MTAIIDFKLAKRMECTYDEKKECLGLIDIFSDMAQKIRKNGYMTINCEIEKIENPFLQKCMQLSYTIQNIDITAEIIENYITVSNAKGKDLLEKIIILQGVKLLYLGHSPLTVEENLSALLGLEDIEEHFKCKQAERMKEINAYINSLSK